MKKTSFSELESVQKEYRLGGRAVLRVRAFLPCGESAAHVHGRALVDELLAFAAGELYPGACRALQEAADAGKAYAFSAWRYEIGWQTLAERRSVRLVLTTRLQRGTDACEQRVLVTRWTADGSLQLAARCKKRRKGEEKI